MLRFKPGMSSPTRQVSVRRLPPLPNQVQIKPILKENGVPLDSCRSRHSRTSACLTEHQIKDYLTTNPNVLDELILEVASREQLERWLIRKTHLLSTTGNNDDRVRTSLSKWKFCVHTDKRKMLQQLTREINQQPQKARIMYELTNNIAKATHADKHSLYLLDKNGADIYLYSDAKPSCKTLCRQSIGKGGTIAAYVAETGERLYLKDILGDERFPKGIGLEDTTAQSVLCQPIIQADGTLVGIVEFVKSLGNSPFQKEDEEIVNSYLVWGSIAIHHAEISKQIQKQKDLNNFLLDVVRSIFDEVCTMDVVIERIMIELGKRFSRMTSIPQESIGQFQKIKAFAKRLVNADRCSLFMLDTKNNELYANLFDEGNEDGSFRSGKEIRFPSHKGVAGYVACTGNFLNIHDAYKDERFNREVDLKTGYTTHTILCFPVRCKGSVIGVVQMVNSLSGFFTEDDCQAFEMFAGYCGLALHYSKMYTSLFRAQQKHQVALEVISYHCCAAEREAEEFLISTDLVMIPPEFYSWEFDIYQSDELLTHYFIKLTKDLFDHCQVRVDLETIARFALSARKCYRDIPYHNWCHAFSVAHSLYHVTRNNEQLTNLEKLALYIAGICHDVDHRGKNNAFMLQCKTPLANLYTTSTMEWHHFKQGVFILESEGQNIFNQMETETYRNILELVQEAIIATDLMLFFGRKNELETLKENGTFSWEKPEHRSLVRCLLMTACDLCTSAKPWDIQVVAVNKVFEEFYSQGDEEKKMGVDPLPMMDRAKHHDLPENQVGFLKGIVKPCYTLLKNFIPELDPTITYIDSNLRQWEKMAKKRRSSTQLLIPEEERIQRSISFIDY